jgi:hypothetical protein
MAKMSMYKKLCREMVKHPSGSPERKLLLEASREMRRLARFERETLTAQALPLPIPKTLFSPGTFTSAAGLELHWKIECDALTLDDWKTIAKACEDDLPEFGRVLGVPRGGLALAEAFKPYVDFRSDQILIVDDVWTTGKSMRAFAAEQGLDRDQWHGFVAFARGDVDRNVDFFMTMSKNSGSGI